MCCLLIYAVPVVGQGIIEGTVTDAANGASLPGVNVIVVGANTGAATSADGAYRIEGVPAGNHTLEAQFVGFESMQKEVTVTDGETTVVNFALEESTVGLDEVVVTGVAGSSERRSLGNSVTQIEPGDAVELEGASNVEELLTGRSPGVSISPGTGVVGSGPKIDMRGTSSFVLSEQPLIYIDGIRVDNEVAVGPDIQGGSVTSRLNNINPRNIENVEIIKGPSAATLYGTEASSGVMQITTKEGFAGDPRFTFSIDQGINHFLNAKDRIPINWGERPETGEIVGFNVLEHEREEVGNEIFRKGHIQRYTAGLRGGSNLFKFNIRGGYSDESGVEPTNNLNRLNTRLSLSFTPLKTFTGNVKLGIITGETELAREYGGSAMWAISRARPSLLDDPLRGFWSAPPDVYHDVYETTQEYNHSNLSIKLNHEPADYYSQELTMGMDLINEENIALQKFANPYEAQFFSESGAKGSKNINTREVKYTTIDYSGSLNLSLTEDINSITSIGFQYYNRLREFKQVTGEEFPLDGLRTVDATSRSRGGENYIQNKTVGTYLQEKLDWNNRLFLTGAIRADDNSAFGRDFEFVLYPKVSASWVVSEESFWDIGMINQLRLRAAYGESGRQPDAFASLRRYAPVSGPGGQSAVTPSNLGNAALGPERGKEYEGGFEAEFFDGRSSIDFTYYDQITTDAILSKNVAPSSGFSEARFVNAGRLEGQGFELSLYTNPISTDNVTWDIALNVDRRSTEVVRLDLESPGEELERLIGHDPGSIFQKRIVSAEVNDQGRATNIRCAGGAEGDEVVACDEAPLYHYGDTQPDFEGSLSNTITLFRDLTLNARFDFETGRKRLYWDGVARCSIYRICKPSAFPQEADPVELAEIQLGQADHRTSWWQDANFIKFRSLSLNYSVPESVLKYLGAQRASITLSANNIYIWSNYDGIDPENGVLASDNGFDQAIVPQLTSFVTSISLTF